MKYLYLPLSLIAFSFTACEQENELKLQKGTVANQSLKESSNSNSILQNLPSNDIPIQPIFSENQTANSSSNSSVQLNPEHGQPGHICEIPVGSPLNSEPTSTNNVSQNTIEINPSNKNATSTPINLTKMGNSALNPEHGKPGHRCDIAVGAPLNSAPDNTQKSIPTTKEAISPLQIQPSASTNNLNDQKINTSENPNAKINPEHGQPGHKCEIAVGDPLPEN